MILVTGGTGLVGSHLLVRLAQENEPIRAIYRTLESIEKTKKVFSYYTNIAKDLFANIEWVQADITDVPSMIPAFKDVKKVYHCAAIISFDPADYRTMRKVNIHGTAIIANLSIDAKVEKLCFVSSIATIGDDPKKEVATEENEWVGNEKNNGYAITKYGAETELSAAALTAGLALKAIPIPAIAIISRSFAPSPIAIVCSRSTLCSAAKSRSADALPARSIIAPISSPVSFPSAISRLFARIWSMPNSAARGAITGSKPPDTRAIWWPSFFRVRTKVRAPGVKVISD